MKRFTMMMAVALVLCANFAFAQDDITIDNKNDIVNNNTNTATSNATGGNANATGGNVDFTYSQAREFVQPLGGYQVALPNGPTNTDKHHRTAQSGAFTVQFRMNQKSFNDMKLFLEKSHELDSETRTWDDIRDDLVIQPRFDYPKTELGEEEYVQVVASAGINLQSLRSEEIVGVISVRDKKPRADSVDKMYMAEALYPYAKMGGVNTLVKIDDYFYSILKSNSFGGGIGGALSTLISCVTGGAIGANVGASSGKAGEHVAGGEQYLALRLSAYVPPVETKKPTFVPPPAPTCNTAELLEQIRLWILMCDECPNPCYNNGVLRFNTGNYYAKLYECTKDKKYLQLAIDEYDKGLRDIVNGVEPSGKRTAELEPAKIYKKAIQSNKSWIIREKYGVEAQYGYARNNGITEVPSCFADLKH